jgi:xylulokinase
MSTLIGFDIGSSSVKASLLDSQSGEALASVTSPDTELAINSPRPGWAEQDPETWWKHVVIAGAMLRDRAGAAYRGATAIGLSYQMHGLVLVDSRTRVLRPAIIWCDSRAVESGEKLAAAAGPERCLEALLNLPGNFTASKLAWVKENEPGIFSRVHKMLLPGDYIALRMTDRAATTVSGLSEGMLWDFRREEPAEFVLDAMGVSVDVLPERVDAFGPQGSLTASAASELGLKTGVTVSYRAGDQPNNAFSLKVLGAGEGAVTAGTSGVIYGVSDRKASDRESRVNVFAHVNHGRRTPRYGILLCLNGAGILYRWLRQNVAVPGGKAAGYEEMNRLAASVPAGSEGLFVLPYGNGSERTLGNMNFGASIHGLSFNTHSQPHLFRAAQEGIACALNYGLEIMSGMGTQIRTVRAGLANMFQSSLFAEIFATITGAEVELYNTDGSLGAARGAGIGAGTFRDSAEAFTGLRPIRKVEPSRGIAEPCLGLYREWRRILDAEKGRYLERRAANEFGARTVDIAHGRAASVAVDRTTHPHQHVR